MTRWQAIKAWAKSYGLWVLFLAWGALCFCGGLLTAARMAEPIAQHQARLFVERQASR